LKGEHVIQMTERTGFFSGYPFSPPGWFAWFLAFSLLCLFAPWLIRPWLFRQLVDSPRAWLIRPLADSPSVLGWFAFWLVRPLACSPSGWFAPSPRTIRPSLNIPVIRYWGLCVSVSSRHWLMVISINIINDKKNCIIIITCICFTCRSTSFFEVDWRLTFLLAVDALMCE